MDNKKRYKLHSAVYIGDRENVRQLLKNGEAIEEKAHDGLTPLMISAKHGRTDIMADLLAAGAKANAVGGKGEAALHYAVNHDDHSVIDALLSHGGNANAVDRDGYTPLHYAATYDCPLAILALLNGGAKNNAQDALGRTPLYLGVLLKSTAAVRVIIKSGADVNLTDKRGDTPLHVAALKGHWEISQLLVAAGANIQRTNAKGHKPLHYAQKSEEDDAKRIADALIRADNSIDVVLPTDNATIGVVVFDRASPSVVEIHAPGEQGSGVIVKPGIVATNSHVVRRGNVLVRWEGHSYRAQKRDDVIEEDFCLLNVSGLVGVPAKIRPYHTLRVGEIVYAIGNPKGESRSLSMGVISQLRQEKSGRQIQTDAAVSPGSSGGGLFDVEGHLIGITTRRHPSEDAENINYAIPADWVLGYHFDPAPSPNK